MGSETPASSPVVLEEVPCAICGPGPARPIAAVRDINLFVPGEFGLVRCLRCGLRYLSPRPAPDAIGRYYPPEYWTPAPERDAVPPPEGAAGLVVDQVARDHPGGRVLDVGCGIGWQALWMEERGLRVVGVEPGEHAAAAARDRYGLNVVTGSLRDASFPAESFDAVTLFDVLEHTHEPVAEMAEARRLLRPGGSLYVKVPNIAALQAALFGRWWYALDAPRHLYHFSPATLGRAFRAAGFQASRIRAVPDSWDALYFERSVIYRLRMPRAADGAAAAGPDPEAPTEAASGIRVYPSVPRTGKRLFRWLLRSVLYAPISIENRVGRAPTLVGVARK